MPELSMTEYREFADSLFDAVKGYIDERLFLVEKHCKDLEKILAKKGIEYRGVHQKSDTYRRGDMVTFDGCMWHCCAAETTKPPGQTEDWQLAVRKGKDA